MPPTITRAADRTVKMVFQKSGIEGRSSFSEGRPSLFGQSSFRRICTISPFTVQHTNYQNDPPVHYFENGNHIYVSHINGHFIWDVDPSMCDSDCDCAWDDSWSNSDDEEYMRSRSRRKKKQSCKSPQNKYPPDEPDHKPKFSLKRRSQKVFKDYPFDFSKPIPWGVTPQGYQAITPQEEVLNWHTDNTISQNKMLLRIDNTLDTLVEKTSTLMMQVDSIQAQVNELIERLSTQAYQLDHDLKAYIQSQYFGPEFQKKNQELIRIKAHLKQIEEDKARHPIIRRKIRS
ncbi:hypothetical protein PIB30_084570 [Stylosanthes scabra]|uniref:Uncharacterized protein n=1 Tax=Stylosanthes scabra TaxID=79078 RepID=A0ABU6XTP9_9FABA|nr:hypothetical protein [Stylosanthes scabra]